MTDEKKFKQCLQSLIDVVTNTSNNLKEKTDEQQLMNDLKKKLYNLLEKYLPILSIQYRNYLLNLLYQYDYNAKEKTLSNAFTKDRLIPFLHDLEDRLVSFDVFQEQEHEATASILFNTEQGIIQVVKGDITKQTVDVIITSSSSENLQQSLLTAAGDHVEANSNLSLIYTPPGHLYCKRIFFLKWELDKDPELLRQSIADLIFNILQNVRSHNFTSIAFPAIGCSETTMVRKMEQEIQEKNLPWTVKFIIQQNVYDEFCKQQILSVDTASSDYQIPSTWQRTNDDQMRVIVSENTDEYNSIISKFAEAMKGKYREIIKLERIQNERWYIQYMAHAKEFKQRLKEDTEKRLYHGCSNHSADLIIQDCFNRSFAGVNVISFLSLFSFGCIPIPGVRYGVGVYFSSNANYSHRYTKPNSKGERFMFVARVLVGKTTRGNTSMKTRPLGFDSTTDGNHIIVTYHDAQAYAEYLITYTCK